MQPFKLDTVLRIRRQAEEKARQALFAAMEKEQQAKDIFQAAQQELEDLYMNLQSQYSQGTSVTQLELIENWISVVKQKIKKAEQEVLTAKRQTESKRQKVLKASKDLKIMEKMKEQQNNAYKQYLNKKERAMLDELAVLFHKNPDQ
ncbi:flagellar export protein FliJ [Desulfogranum japonicum]|uniref:flagellar export protein FliJ n=1 Tax=Desulfogranum japonicum TaxID=231447 RepID=UPI0004239BEE|nr:flagellar export protein FliJ [Desulfogranum japonicum]